MVNKKGVGTKHYITKESDVYVDRSILVEEDLFQRWVFETCLRYTMASVQVLPC